MSSEKQITGYYADNEKTKYDDQRIANRVGGLRKVDHLRTALNRARSDGYYKQEGTILVMLY